MISSEQNPNHDDSPPNRAVYALAADMIFAAKIRGAAQALEIPIILARNAAHLIAMTAANDPDSSLIILDLDTRGLDIPATVAALKAQRPTTQLLAYVSHVNADAITAARDAGADKVLARSAFTSTLSQILRSTQSTST